MIKSGNDTQVFPTRLTAVIGNSLLINDVIQSESYHYLLLKYGILSYRKILSKELKTYLCYGEFLRNVMIITDLTKEIMAIRYPLVNSKEFDAIQLRMGGKLADYPIKAKWLTQDSLNVAVNCARKFCKSYNVYVASDSMMAKNYMLKHLRNKNVSFVNEKSLFSDPQVMSMNSVYIATYTAVADLYILGKSKSCIMTQKSTFAFAGCALTGNNPIIVSIDNKTCLGSESLMIL